MISPIKHFATRFALQVSNQKLMQSGITNLSDSKPVAVYTNIEVDATIPIDAIDELSVRMQATATAHEDLFDQTFECKAYVMNIVAPLKYQVRCFLYLPL